GLVDAHVHVNEPGRTEWEGFVTATRAAAAGGITSIVDMPLNCIPVTTTREALRIKRDAIGGLLRVDVAFWGGVIPGNAGELDGLVDDGIAGAKCFLVHSGIDEFPNATEADLRLAMPILARRGVPLLVHAELGEHLVPPPAVPPSKYAAWLDSRPRAAEDEAIRFILKLARETGCRVHIVHLSSSDALPIVAQAKADGVRASAETCPHYLTLAAEDVPDGHTEYKCAPPIRERENREKLWAALGAGVLDFVVSDHSPCTPHLKHLESGDFTQAWGGISSVQLGLPLVWTGAHARGIELPTVVRWMSERTAAFAGLAQKGSIAPGKDADLVVFDPHAEFVVREELIQHRHKLNPYLGRTLRGVVRETILRGETVFADGAFPGDNRGAFLRPALSH
ncbi:MAG: allantoinase AllB, partial [Deltaproteobacteria bacterium]|nr:allantoinase AllB [Deltaproteobacteria bacterium]